MKLHNKVGMAGLTGEKVAVNFFLQNMEIWVDYLFRGGFLY